MPFECVVYALNNRNFQILSVKILSPSNEFTRLLDKVGGSHYKTKFCLFRNLIFSKRNIQCIKKGYILTDQIKLYKFLSTNF